MGVPVRRVLFKRRGGEDEEKRTLGTVINFDARSVEFQGLAVRFRYCVAYLPDGIVDTVQSPVRPFRVIEFVRCHRPESNIRISSRKSVHNAVLFVSQSATGDRRRWRSRIRAGEIGWIAGRGSRRSVIVLLFSLVARARKYKHDGVRVPENGYRETIRPRNALLKRHRLRRAR